VNTLDIGAPVLTELYVNGASGNDSNSGLTVSAPLRSVEAAWNKIPRGVLLTGHGYRINLASGYYPESSLPNYWESRYGNFAAPIILQGMSANPPAVLQGDINMFDTSYFYLIDVSVVPQPAGDAFHCEQCDHLLIRRAVLDGGRRDAHETLKINQSQYVFVEDSDIHGADDNAIDFVSVQYGHVVRNRVHDSADWCAYMKGGSAYLTFDSNEVYDCGTGGFTAGQGTGFEFMRAPWLHYEAYDIKAFNNIVHDVEGAAFGVNGGYNILLAYNVAYRIGARDHAIEVVFGNRSCDGDSAACGARQGMGGWGPGSPEGDSDDKSVPNKNVFIYNNIVFNPSDYAGPAQIFAIYGPRVNRGDTNLPSPAMSDDNLQIRGNIFWLPSASDLGAGADGQGCQSSNASCNASQLMAENTINVLEPQLINPQSRGADRDFRPISGSSIFGNHAFSSPSFPGSDRPSAPLSPAGVLENNVRSDRGGELRDENAPVSGAYLSALSRRDPVPGTPGSPDGGDGGGSSGDHTAPVLSKAKLSKKSVRANKKVSLQVVAKDDVGIARVFAYVGAETVELRLSGKAKKGVFKGSYRATLAGEYAVVITAIDTSNNWSQTGAGNLRVR